MLRRPSLRASLTTVAAAAVLVTGAGLASYAATGHPLILGHANKAGGTTSLKNTGRGPALKLNSIRSAPPLVVNSKKMVKNLNANMVGGKTLAQLSPKMTRVRIGTPGGTLSNAQHFVTVKAPSGDLKVTTTGLWTSTLNTDSITCIAADSALFPSGTDLSLVWALLTRSLGSTGTDNINLGTTQYVHIPRGRHAVVGCTTEGDTGTVTLIQPINISFEPISSKIAHGTPFVIGPKHGRIGQLLGR
jgi:hypothetical protein